MFDAAAGKRPGDAGAAKPALGVKLCGLEWKNPVATASGTFSARYSGKYYDFSELGAVTTKGVATEPWNGNPPPRIAESWGGVLNAIGLQNPGVERYIAEEVPFIMDRIERARAAGPRTLLISNAAGRSVDEYAEVARRLDGSGVDMIELNISCPNVKQGGMAFGTDPRMAAKATAAARAATGKPLIVKLTPNVADVAEIARAAESAGADAISLINTVAGMRIDVKRRAPVLANVMGGLSGPAIKPVAVRMVWQVSRAVKIPVIGMGGIMSGEDAAEFFMAGASAVAVGTAALVNPAAPIEILEGLARFMAENGFGSIDELKAACAQPPRA
jgi:dihydroorotate dehydrogenase (NAD+) catalytic subunit